MLDKSDTSFTEIIRNSGNYNPTFVYDNIISKSYEWKWNPKIQRECCKIIRRYKDYNNLIGFMCEAYVRYNIQNDLRQEGYVWRDRLPRKPKTYFMKTHYQTPIKKNNGGIDIYIRILDEYLNDYHCKIEVSNWGNYSIRRKWYYNQISSKHKRYSRLDNCVRMDAIPYYNIEKLRDWYDEDNIIPLPINEQIIPKYENNFIRRVGSNLTGEVC